MLKAFKYRIYPSVTQKEAIDQTIDACRLVYNLALETKTYAWRSARVVLSRSDLQRQTTELMSSLPWLRTVNSQAVYAVLETLDQSFKHFFSGNGYPKFKKKTGRQSFRCCTNRRRIDWERSTLTIPKIKDIPIRLSRRFYGEIKTVTISRTVAGKYFASVLVENKMELPVKPVMGEVPATGIDLGVKSFAVTSDGRLFEPNKFLKNSLKRLQCLQRRASRKKKGGNNRKRANLEVAILHEKIANQRADYIHKITTELVRDSQAGTFVIEDLNVVGMVKNRCLSRSISDASFGIFFRQMKYKCEWYGKNLVVIDRFAPSSKRCSDCGMINDFLTLADREWMCSCGAHHDRDLNAAKNIKFFGLNTPAGSRGEPVESRRLRWAKKQESRCQKEYGNDIVKP